MPDYPIKFTVDYPEKLSRGKLILRTLFGWAYIGIPHFFCLFFYGIAASFVGFIAWFAILFTGKYPQGMFNFVVSFYRWGLRVIGHMANLTDKYPPLSGKE
jgi:hypothetical protein